MHFHSMKLCVKTICFYVRRWSCSVYVSCLPSLLVVRKSQADKELLNYVCFLACLLSIEFRGGIPETRILSGIKDVFTTSDVFQNFSHNFTQRYEDYAVQRSQSEMPPTAHMKTFFSGNNTSFRTLFMFMHVVVSSVCLCVVVGVVGVIALS
jgi:hypothetical protein